jgi:hypothetical protein
MTEDLAPGSNNVKLADPRLRIKLPIMANFMKTGQN